MRKNVIEKNLKISHGYFSNILKIYYRILYVYYVDIITYII
jgi:hypothetical protein